MNRKLAASLVLFALSLAALPALADPRAPLPSTPKTATPQPVTPKATARSKVALDDGGFYATARAGYGGFFTKAGSSP